MILLSFRCFSRPAGQRPRRRGRAPLPSGAAAGGGARCLMGTVYPQHTIFHCKIRGFHWISQKKANIFPLYSHKNKVWAGKCPLSATFYARQTLGCLSRRQEPWRIFSPASPSPIPFSAAENGNSAALFGNSTALSANSAALSGGPGWGITVSTCLRPAQIRQRHPPTGEYHAGGCLRQRVQGALSPWRARRSRRHSCGFGVSWRAGRWSASGRGAP